MVQADHTESDVDKAVAAHTTIVEEANVDGRDSGDEVEISAKDEERKVDEQFEEGSDARIAVEKKERKTGINTGDQEKNAANEDGYPEKPDAVRGFTGYLLRAQQTVEGASEVCGSIRDKKMARPYIYLSF